MLHFTPTQLAEHLESGEQALTLLDVRETWEFETCHIDGSVLIPMGEIPSKLTQIDNELPIVVICHHGRRSFNVATFLEGNGFKNVINLTGGVDAWAKEVDSAMATY